MVRVVLLDEVVLKYQGLIVVSGYHVVNVTDLLHQGLCLTVPVGQEILADPLSQALCLADVDDSAFAVLHQVAARIKRKRMSLCLRLLEVLTPFLELVLCKLLVDLIAQTDLKCILVHELDSTALEEKIVVN